VDIPRKVLKIPTLTPMSRRISRGREIK